MTGSKAADGGKGHKVGGEWRKDSDDPRRTW
jgi:hypothetical protein